MSTCLRRPSATVLSGCGKLRGGRYSAWLRRGLDRRNGWFNTRRHDMGLI
jgi:hypothetical protein